MRWHLIGALAGLFGCLGLSGCFPIWSHSALQPIQDHQLTYDDFNDTMDLEPVGGVFPPLPVHQFDHDGVEAAGGYLAIDGSEWFAADAEERGDLLAEVQEGMPSGSVIVIEVATGEVWVVPASAGRAVADGMITAWTEAEYENLPDFVYEEPSFGFYGPTAAGYAQLTAIGGNGSLRPVVFIHPLVQAAAARLQLQNAVAFAMMADWRFLTPLQRYGLMLNLQNYLLMTAYYGANPFLFGVAVPGGGIYAFPELALWQLAAVYGARPWTPQEIIMLSATGILPAIVTMRRNEIIRRQLEVRD